MLNKIDIIILCEDVYTWTTLPLSAYYFVYSRIIKTFAVGQKVNEKTKNANKRIAQSIVHNYYEKVN